jgi:hypothetical protein
MPSSFTQRLRLELQAAGENLNTWGAPKLNNVISRLDFAVAGWTTIALTGNYALSASNGDDEARSAMLKFTGTGPYAVTIPSVSKAYDVWNATSGDLTITTGAGSVAVLKAGEVVRVVCDGTNCKRVQGGDFGGTRVTGVADPASSQDAATKAYVDATAFAMTGGALPGQSGSTDRLLATDGASASWGPIKVQSTATTGLVFPLTSGGARLGGICASAVTGEVGLINASGAYRLKTTPDGRAYLASDFTPSALSEIATQDLAIAYAVSL